MKILPSQRESLPDPPDFVRFGVHDSLGRPVTFYISQSPPAFNPLPLAVCIQGSGCQSLFQMGNDGCVRGGYQTLLAELARNRLKVLAVEKPGVRYLDDPHAKGTAEGCSEEFLREHTLTRWTESLNAAVQAARSLPDVCGSGLLAVGHSEGGIVAAHLAAENPAVSHVAILSGSGPSQLFDLAASARANGDICLSAEMQEERVREVFETFRQICADSDSTTKFAWGHPYRLWSSFLSTSTLYELLRSQARIYLAHGSHDSVVPVAAFDVLVAELIRHQRDVTYERIEAADHRLCVGDAPTDQKLAEVLWHVIDWFHS